MRICLDLDGVICEIKRPDQTYADVAPIDEAIQTISDLYDQGHRIIINTARHMKTCESNLGLVNARVAKVTIDWLEKHGIKYHEIYFAKPWADLYIDDNAHRFSSWEDVVKDVAEKGEK